MIELPEAFCIAGHINNTIRGKRIAAVTAGHTPHKLAWYYGEPSRYSDLLVGKKIGKATACGALVEISAGKASILLGEGVAIRFHPEAAIRPPKHQLLIEFEDRSALSAAIQMYGGMGAFPEGELDNPYYKAAKEKPSSLSPDFDEPYFNHMVSEQEVQKLSLKAFLAAEQRIPGLGNGVLQDILLKAKMHPKKKVNSLSSKDRYLLFTSAKSTLEAMAAKGGRDTELDLFGRPGGYRTLLCRNTVNKPCLTCGTLIKKESYMGGSIYYCEKCQRL
jgi:formamidopyrimidine-DNA glycosylase